jgi:GNAT superfamily N-acetyltransferase
MGILDKLQKRYPIQPAKDEELPQLLEVFREVWANNERVLKINERLHRRRYFENPYSKGAASIMVARDGDRIIGFTGAMDFELWYHDRMYPATCTVDQAVLPAYQARSIGYLLLKPHYERDVIAFAGDLNGPAQKMHEAMEVPYISNCYIMRRMTHPTDILTRWQDREYTVDTVRAFDGRFNQLWLAAREGYEIVGVRNQAILKWRYENLPTRKFTTYTLCRKDELMGYIVTTTERAKGIAPKGILADFLFGRIAPEVISRFIAVVIGHLARKGAICVEVAASHAESVGVLRDLGFHATKHKTYFVVYKNERSRNKPDLWDGRKWHLTYGDSDFYFTR